VVDFFALYLNASKNPSFDPLRLDNPDLPQGKPFPFSVVVSTLSISSEPVTMNSLIQGKKANNLNHI
jgi:hypothetical protein